MKPTTDRSATYVPAFTLDAPKPKVVVHEKPKVQAPNFINDVAAARSSCRRFRRSSRS